MTPEATQAAVDAVAKALVSVPRILRPKQAHKVVAALQADRSLLLGLLAEEPIGFVRHNGAGEIVFKQAGHPTYNEALMSDHWSPVIVVPKRKADDLS